MSITKAMIIIGEKPMRRTLSPTMIYVLREMRDCGKDRYSLHGLGVSFATMNALFKRGMVKSEGGWYLTKYGIDTINYIDKRKRIP